MDDFAAARLATLVQDDVELARDHLHAVEVLLVLDKASNGWSQELPASHATTAGGRAGDASAGAAHQFSHLNIWSPNDKREATLGSRLITSFHVEGLKESMDLTTRWLRFLQFVVTVGG